MPRLREIPHEDLPKLFEEVSTEGWGGRPARPGGFHPAGPGEFNPSGQSGNFFRVWANHPELFKDMFLGTNVELMKGKIVPPAFREIAILRTAFIVGSRTVFTLHYNEAYWIAGIAREKSDEIPTWVNSTAFDPEERAILAYVDEMALCGGRVQEITIDRLKAFLSDAQILELSYVIGLYTIHGHICKALRLEWDDVPERVVPVPRSPDAPSDEEVIEHLQWLKR